MWNLAWLKANLPYNIGSLSHFFAKLATNVTKHIKMGEVDDVKKHDSSHKCWIRDSGVTFILFGHSFPEQHQNDCKSAATLSNLMGFYWAAYLYDKITSHLEEEEKISEREES